MAVLTMMVSLLQAQSNVLRVDSVEGPAGKTVTLPIIMENQSDIAGVQFDIAVPVADAENSDMVVFNLSKTRAEGFNMVTRKLGTTGVYIRPGGTGSQWTNYYRYRIIIYSDDNNLILGNDGTLLTMQFVTNSELTDKTEMPVTLSNVSLSDRDMVNKLTATKGGLITIKEIPRPDLTPTDVTFTPNSVEPGGQLDVSWKVKNVGKANTSAGWSEEIALVNGTTTKVLTTVHYADSLFAESEVSRNVSLTLPSLLGIDGIAQVQVTVIPDANAGEHQSLRDNNVAKSDNNLQVAKHLTLEIKPNRVTESYYSQRIAITLTRSGNWSEAQSFKVTCTDSKGQPSAETRVALPEIINILEGQSAAISYLTLTNNSVLDPDTLIHFKVEPVNTASTYAAVEADLVIEDDEYPTLTLVSSKSEVTEGETFRLTATTERASNEPITVTLTCENSKRFTFPSTITIQPGELSASVDVTAVDNDTPEGTQTIQFTVSAPNHNKGQVLVQVNDNDLPVLELSIKPTQVQESDGPVCVAGVLKRLTNKDKKVTVRITDDADGKLYFGNRSFTLDKGVEEVHFNFGPVDNQDVDGDRNYTITAAVWMSSCSCSATAEAAGHVSAQLTVLDDDGAALRLTSQSGTVKEGGTTTLTITRNNAPDADLTVTLTSDYDDQLEYDHTVTIPAGQRSVEVEVKSKLNDVSGDSHTVIFTVTTDGYASGTCWVMVTDQTLPDAVFKSISVNPTACLVGDPVMVTLEVANEGNRAALSASTTIDIFEQGVSEPLASFVLGTPLPVDNTRTVEKQVTLPKTVATHPLYAILNRNNTVQELSTTNNTSATVSVEVNSPFMATLQTDKTKYNQNDVVIFNGQLTGRDTEDAELDLYIVGDGVRQVQRVRANADGTFDYRWPLNGAFIGHCVAGVCYPDAGSRAEITAFDVYGLRRTATGYIKFQPTVGVEVQSAIELENPGVLPLTGVQVEVLEKPENFDFDVNIPATIEGGAKPLITYSFTPTAPSTGSNWQTIKLNVTTNEGVELPITIYLFARMAQANLITPNQRITTTMTKGQTREYPVTLINNGQGNTGTITLALPDWIKCAQGATLAGINKGDTATIVLQFRPTEQMELNVPVTGTIGYNVQYGNSTYSNFSITPVSDQTGTLVVEVADEYTYYTDEKPHVKDAEVVLRNSVTNAIVTIDGQPAQGRTGEDGLVTFENLPEGYYKLSVTADDHDSYSNNIIVDPGVTTRKTVNLSVQAIKVSWTVEETEVEDVYEIVTTMTYETNVPAPVVELISPSRLPLDSLAEGESFMFYAIATNKGLINAENAAVELPDTIDGKYVFEPQVENTGLTIAPQMSYIVPVKVTRISVDPTASSRRRAGSSGGCTDKVGTYYEWKCGADHKWNRVTKPFTYSVCPGGPGGGGGFGGGGGGGGGLGSPGGGGGGGYSPTTHYANVDTKNDCNPCLNALGGAGLSCAGGFTPAGCPLGLAGCGSDIADSEVGIAETVIDCILGVAGCIPAVSTVASVASCIKGLGKAGWQCFTGNYSRATDNFIDEDGDVDTSASRANAPKKSGAVGISYIPPTNISWVDALFECIPPVSKSLDGMLNYITEVMGDTLWLDVKAAELENLMAIVTTYKGQQLLPEELLQYKPENITDSLFTDFIERYNLTRQYDLDGIVPADTNYIHRDRLVACLDSINTAEALAVEKGYVSLADWWDTTFGDYKENMEESSGSVCSSISLQIKQEMVLTRQAFRGTLTVFNGHKTTAMTNMKLNLVVSDMYNNVATAHEFQINAESLKNMEGELKLDGGWTLAANSEGVVTVLFIPTKYAAPTEPVEYSFGGTLSYTDPYSGLEVTRDLYPVTLTVKPSPDLVLTYFMQRDLYGDDPLTEDIIEPVEPGEFALLINNQGYGDATNVRMTTQQPEIIENEKGLFIDFEIVSSQVNGGPAALSFGQTIANTLGDIPAHSQTYAQWWLQSSLLGHFTSYDLSITHVTSYGNEDLSLVDIENSSIHELIHGFTPPGETAPARAFLCNDVEDAKDLPDQVYFTDATQQNVTVAQSTSSNKINGYTYEITVLPSQAGWTYATMLDPTVGKQKLLKVVRKRDNLELPTDNVWQTSRSLRDGMEWLYENRLHFVGDMPATGETYELTYEVRPDVELDFQFSQPEYDPEFVAEGLVTSDVNEVTITFNKPIQAETFDYEDVTYQVQGEKQDLSQVEGLISPKVGVDNAYTINLSTLNPQLPNGYYVLSVQGAGITDNEGFNGLFGRKVDWVLFRGGLIDLNAKPFPANAGSINYVLLHNDAPSTESRMMEPADPTGGVVNQTKYGEQFKLTATPKEGYEFVSWTIDGEVVSTEPEYIVTANGDINILANFKKKQFMVEITAEGNGTLRGAGTGRYEFETELEIEAVPETDFILKEWVVDGVVVPATSNTYTLTVTKATDVKAVFIRDIYEQTITMARGWNWISTYLREQQSLGEMTQYANRLLDQQNELFRDPEFGLVGGITAITPAVAYKVEASARFSRTMRGHLLGDADAATISVKKGWNWIAYPYFSNKKIADVLTNAEEGDYISGQEGFSTFADNTWEGTISELAPGQGYLYKSASEKNLSFDFTEAAGSRAYKAYGAYGTNGAYRAGAVDIHRYPNTMNITARIYRDGIELPGDQYTIYAMSADDMRGMSQFIGKNHYLTVYGDQQVDIIFVVEQNETGDRYVANESLQFVSDVVGSRKSPFAINIGTTTGIDQIADSSRPMTVYSLSGILVSRDATLKTLKRLPKGVYIVNGLKTVLK